MSACFRLDMHKQGAFRPENYTTPSPGSASYGPGGGGGAIHVGGRDDELSTSSLPYAMYDEAIGEEDAARDGCGCGSVVSDTTPQPPPPGELSRKFAADVTPDCQFLFNATQR